MARTIRIVEVLTLLTPLSEPQWFTLADVDYIEPRVARFVVCELENDINLFKGSKSGLGIEEVY